MRAVGAKLNHRCGAAITAADMLKGELEEICGWPTRAVEWRSCSFSTSAGSVHRRSRAWAVPQSSDEMGGLGIGLTVVRQLAELHGGSVLRARRRARWRR